MPPFRASPTALRQSRQIACTAARLVAEQGLDYAQAKRKALALLALPENTRLPEDAALEVELRTYQRLYQNAEQTERIDRLRRSALELMRRLHHFTPYLSGAVADGSAPRYAAIDIQLFPDSAKEVEIFLLNAGIAFTHSTPRTARAEAVLTVHGKDALAHLVIYPRDEERQAGKTRTGHPRPRLRLAALERLLAESTTTESPDATP